MTQRLLPLRIVVIPGWVLRAALRHNLNTVDLLDYNKIKPILSIDDMAEWFFLNDGFTLDKHYLSNINLLDAITGFTEAQKAEVLNSVLPLSRSETIACCATTKLGGSNPMNCCEYQFIPIANALYVVLNEGFMAKIADPDYKSEFVKAYLQECYSVISIPEVSQLSLYKLYLSQFKI